MRLLLLDDLTTSYTNARAGDGLLVVDLELGMLPCPDDLKIAPGQTVKLQIRMQEGLTLRTLGDSRPTSGSHCEDTDRLRRRPGSTRFIC